MSASLPCLAGYRPLPRWRIPVPLQPRCQPVTTPYRRRKPAAARPHESSSIATPLYRSSCIDMASPCIQETLASEEAPDDKTGLFVALSQPTVCLPSTMPYIVTEYNQNIAKAGPAH
ncbi:hypothetical protein D7B24_009170 [Verticillium nonalfalfae]|uniref:Uncharacterized protein n=1 Tax=Verticillium nonalfalfae TaxID=1051616 RepID=A0A3M9YJ84_9PEZI|nr:uncharacterized protein D7B24_009170 [Verticillium nonalfalfae]RNJ60141.1 hypothetical protein D7B24_009170 [Verticillium nonalfalfae]